MDFGDRGCLWCCAREHARLQIITLAELFRNVRPDIPWVDTSGQKTARREATAKQAKLL